MVYRRVNVSENVPRGKLFTGTVTANSNTYLTQAIVPHQLAMSRSGLLDVIHSYPQAVNNSASYPQAINSLSTGYQQVNSLLTSALVNTLLTC